MRFGVHFQLSCDATRSASDRYLETTEQAVAAERLGFESVWPVEQHFDAEASISPAPMLLLAALASRTTTIRLGTAITLLPLTNPVRVAEEVATLDVISGGRAECGVGRGMDPTHFAGIGVPIAESSTRFAEGVDIVEQALSRPRFTHHGAHHRLSDVTVVPRPVQTPRPPIRLAANNPATFELAGRLGLPIIVATHINPLPALADTVDRYRRARRETGHPDDADDVTVLAPTFTAPTMAALRRDVQPGLDRIATLATRRLDTALSSLPAGLAGNEQRARLLELRAGLTGLDVDTMATDRAIFGTPARCVDQLRAVRARLRTDRVICWFEPGGVIPHRRVLDAMTLFSRAVMPALVEETVAA
jgi:alkanesulfonate monooxygenase SsuD/methylene tetrahydromethanopterin reductase-like flavin-dependent oxidoreductase (luciferase family)